MPDSTKEEWIAQAAKMEAERDRLRAALKKIAEEGMDLGGLACEEIAQDALNSETR